MGLSTIRKDSKRLHEKETPEYKDYVNKQFNPKGLKEVWVSDVTQFRFNQKNFYICVILNLYARKVIGHKASLRISSI